MIVKKNNIEFSVHEDRTPSNPNFWSLLDSGKWEPNTFKIFDRFLSKDKSFVDIGAWIGPTTLYGCQIAKQCYSIEPDKIAYDILCENLLLNNFYNVTTVFGAIGSENGSLRIGGNYGNSVSSIYNDKNTAVVPAFTMESFFRVYNIKNCNFIKMDVEGAETIIFPASVMFLSSFDHAMFLSVHPIFFRDPHDMAKLLTHLHSIYSHIYTETGQEMSSEEFLAQRNVINIVCTKEKLTTLW